jgi:flagellin
MSTTINTNISALNAQGSLRKIGLEQNAAMQRLSTGIRINSAKDDAAGLAISTRMTANIRGMAAAVRNSNDGISLTQTAEGALASIQDNLQRIRELAVQSSNSGNSSSDRSSINLEAQQLISEIDRVATNAAFNGSKLLDGSFANQDFQVGAGNNADDRISISIGSAKANTLGGGGATGTTTRTSTAVTADALGAGDLTINGFAVGASVSDGVSSVAASASAIAKANAINAISGQTGITAKANATVVNLAALTSTTQEVTPAGSLKINGVDIGALSTTNVVAQRLLQFIGAINNVSAQTGVVASDSGTAGVITLTAQDGRNISAVATAGNTGMTGLESVDARSTITLTSSTSKATVLMGGTSTGLAKVGIATGSQTLTATSTTLGYVSGVSLATQTDSQSALSVLDRAIDTVTNSRANLGAYQNRFEAAISNLQTTTMNLSASRSRILDTDYAKETTTLAKSQIITQAATAMLAQANQSAQSVLALLK